MLITKTKLGKFRCGYCNNQFETKEKALLHEETHDFALVPIAKEDLNRLVLFIYTKEDKLLSQDMIRILQKYNTKASLRRYLK